MVTVEYAPKKGLLSVSGHAGAARRGEDLICAGVTTVVEGLALALERLDEKQWLASGSVELGDGAAELAAVALPEYTGMVSGLFLSAVSALLWLERHYPEYVRVNII